MPDRVANEWAAFDLQDLLRQRAEGGRTYLEFLRSSQLSVGVYALPVGGTDGQSPHAEDEVYYVVRGRATLRVGTQMCTVGPGSIVFVQARLPHAFHSIEEDLEVLVFFGPAEGKVADSTRA